MKTLPVICPVCNEQEVIHFFYTEFKSLLAGLADRNGAAYDYFVQEN